MIKGKILIVLSIALFTSTCKSKKKSADKPELTRSVFSLSIESYNTWKAFGPFGSPAPMAKVNEMSPHGAGRFMCINIHPKNKKEILAGHASSGLFKSIDGGISWEQKLNFPFATGIFNILRFPQNSKHLLACSAMDLGPSKQYGYGLLESFDGGETWTRNSLQFEPEEYKQEQCRDVAILDSKKENELICISGHEVFLSSDGGKTWKSSFKTDYFLKEITVDPRNVLHVFVLGNAVLESTDGGKNWMDKTEELDLLCGQSKNPYARYALCYGKKDKSKIYISSENKQVYFLTANGGDLKSAKVLNRQAAAINIARFCMHVSYHADLQKEIIWLGSLRMYNSLDEGLHFNQSSTPFYGLPNSAHDDINDIVSTEDGTVYIATDGGMDYSNDHGKSWISISANAVNLNTTLLFGFDKSKQGIVMAGTQDNGVFVFEDKQWKNCTFYGDGGRVVAINDSNGFSCGIGQVNYFTPDAGKHFQLQHAGNERTGFEFRTQFVKSSSTFYMANMHLYKKTQGKYFEILSSSLETDRKIKAFWVNPLREREIWICKDEATWGNELRNKLLYTRDEGATWEDHSSYLPVLNWRSMNDIHVNAYGEIGIAIDGFDSKNGDLNRVYFSKDGGYTFENISTGLPNLPVNTIIYANDRWICGTNNGIFQLQDKTWTALGNGFPATVVSELRYDSNEDILMAATFGRGLWGIRLN